MGHIYYTRKVGSINPNVFRVLFSSLAVFLKTCPTILKFDFIFYGEYPYTHSLNNLYERCIVLSDNHLEFQMNTN